jgi:hypothetical protein
MNQIKNIVIQVIVDLVKFTKNSVLNKNASFVMVLLGISFAAFGQIDVEKVEVVKIFEVQLEDAIKFDVLPKIEILKPMKKVYKYDVSIVPLEIKYPDPIIKPLAMLADDPFDFNQLYVKAGYGNLRNPFFKMRFGTQGNEKYEINAAVDYFSIDNTKKIEYQESSIFKGDFDVKYRLLENMFVKGGVDFDIDKRFFFFTPYDKNLSTPDQLRRNTSNYRLHAGIQNVEETSSRINYDMNFSTEFINTTNFDANEQIIGVESTFSYQTAKSLVIEAPVNLLTYRYDVIDLADAKFNYVLDINPTINYQKGLVNVRIGGEILLDKEKVRLWPTAEVSAAVVGNYIHALVGVDQRHQINDLKNILAFAPWANSRFDNLNLNVGREFFGGVRGELSTLRYQAKAGFRMSDGQGFFTNYRVRALETNDKVSVDFGKLNTVFISGGMDMVVNNFITVGGDLTKNFYKPELATTTWGLLSLEVNAYAKLKVLNDKLQLKSDIYIADRNNTLFPDANGFARKIVLNNLADLNFGLETWPLKKVGLYVDAYNVLNNKNVRWYGYPQVGIHFNGGVLIKL